MKLFAPLDLVLNRIINVAAPISNADAANKLYVDATSEMITLLTASAAVPVGSYNMVDASAGAVTLTLPTGARNGAIVHAQKTDTSVNAVTFARGGADTIEGATTLVLGNNDAADLISNGAGVWTMRRFLSVPTPGTTMRRDAAGRSQVVTPVAAADIATKAYVDAPSVLTWTAQAASGSWLDYGTPYAGCRYALLDGVVHVQGFIKTNAAIASGTATTVITLPAGFRPALTIVTSKIAVLNTTTSYPTRITITAAGVLQVAVFATIAAGAVVTTDLQVSYPAEA